MQSFGKCLKMADGESQDNGLVSDQDDDCQPKDLSLKSNKKIKPIPPPLNLGLNSPLKEFAIIATSPKSPLMQKSLPFRKRAYSFSGTNDTEQQLTSSHSTSGGQFVMDVPKQQSPLPSLNEEYCHQALSSPSLTKQFSQLDTRLQYSGATCWSPTLKTCPLLGQDSLSPSHFITNTSVLLSPAPSSLESSQEDLNVGDSSRLNSLPSSNVHPWPSPVWHCFQAGVRLKLDLPHGGTGGMWLLAEEVSKSIPDWLGALQVEQITEIEGCITVHFKCQDQWQGEILAQCHLEHTFYIKDRGWCALCPDLVLKQYGFLCHLLELSDICLPPSRLPIISPDICDKFKRFSFSPEELRMPNTQISTSCVPPLTPPDSVLSPPSSPNKKLKDAEQPKRPMNAFMLFAKKYRLELIQLHPGKDNRAISVILGEAWRKLSSSEKEMYIVEARNMAQERKRLHPNCWKRKRSHSAGLINSSR